MGVFVPSAAPLLNDTTASAHAPVPIPTPEETGVTELPTDDRNEFIGDIYLCANDVFKHQQLCLPNAQHAGNEHAYFSVSTGSSFAIAQSINVQRISP
jgi:hypothetical protein